MISAASAAVAVARVGTACTLPERRTRDVPPFEVRDASTIASPCRSTRLLSASAAPRIIGPNTVFVKSSAPASGQVQATKRYRLKGQDVPVL